MSCIHTVWYESMRGDVSHSVLAGLDPARGPRAAAAGSRANRVTQSPQRRRRSADLLVDASTSRSITAQS